MELFYNFLFIGFPYLSIGVFVIGTIHRYRSTPYKYSSLSSQFLEGGSLFWGAVPFHFGILVVFFGHLITFLFPAATLMWNSHPLRLIILEGSAFIFGVSVFISLFNLFYRRLFNERVQMVTTRMDIVIELLIWMQVVLGLWVALGYRWGSSWFAADLTPYLRSLFLLQPDIHAVSAMPTVIQLHIVGAFTIFLLVPFTRLVHFLVAPLNYIVRPYQQVIWNVDRKRVRDPETAWSPTQPRNN